MLLVATLAIMLAAPAFGNSQCHGCTMIELSLEEVFVQMELVDHPVMKSFSVSGVQSLRNIWNIQPYNKPSTLRIRRRRYDLGLW